MGGQLVYFPHVSLWKGFAIQADLNANLLDIDPYSHHYNIKRLPAAFHLPEVCRQIYSEAALTAYQQNVFIFNGPTNQNESRLDLLMEVQRSAIKSVEIGSLRLWLTVADKQVAPMTDSLPNLEHILVSAAALEYTCYALSWQDWWVDVNEKWQTVVLRKLREVYGDQIKIEFEK